MSDGMKTRLFVWHRRVVQQGPRTPGEWLAIGLLLVPSLLFGLLAWLRGKGYDSGLFPVFRARVPVISVGNLAVGGTGKTPVVDWLVNWSRRQGYTPAVVSRGYGGSYHGEVGVVCAGAGMLMTPEAAGDEPCLLARRNPSAIVLVARRRALGVQQAVARHAANLVILDDGFQHRAVARDLDLVLVDGSRPFGNGLPLPAGLLREFPGALRRADLVLRTRVDSCAVSPGLPQAAWSSRHQLADEAVSLSGETLPLAALHGKKLLALAGIARPESFFAALEARGLSLEKRLALADHSLYNGSALQSILGQLEGIDGIVTTEKDGIKLSPELLPVPCYQVPLQIVIENESAFVTALTQRLRRDAMNISAELLAILACPKCKQPVTLSDDGNHIDCPGCRLKYPVRDGIPVMLIDEAESY